MTTIEENDDTMPLDQRLIDRLVDGALSDTERRAVLDRLEAEPGAWRQCALSFLEAQSWREALGTLAAPVCPPWPAPVPVPLSGPEQGGARLRARHRVPPLAAIAAGLLAAFALGWTARGVPLADAPQVARVGAESRAVVAAPSPSGSIQVPAHPRPEPISAPSRPAATPLSEPVVRAWERRGYQVERSQRLVSMELTDGRRLAVPIDEVRLRFVGDRTY